MSIPANHWRRIVLCMLSGFLSVAHADQSPAVSVAGGVEQFVWREFATDQRELLEESGQRFSVALAYDNLRRLESGPVYSLGGKLYLGAVDYDGETQLTGIPVQSTTTYFGAQVDAWEATALRVACTAWTCWPVAAWISGCAASMTPMSRVWGRCPARMKIIMSSTPSWPWATFMRRAGPGITCRRA